MARKILKGVITSNKMQKTVVVEVESVKFNAKYKRYYKQHQTFKAHVENNADYKVGDRVEIQETIPMSKDKRFKVISKK